MSDALMEPMESGLDSPDRVDTVRPDRRRRPQPKDRAMTNPYTFLDTLDTPDIVTEMLARVKAATGKVPRGLEQQYKLSYYFGGLAVAGKEVPKKGYAVAFSGPDEEVAAAIRGLSRAEAESLTLIYPDPLDVHLSNLPRVAPVLS